MTVYAPGSQFKWMKAKQVAKTTYKYAYKSKPVREGSGLGSSIITDVTLARPDSLIRDTLAFCNRQVKACSKYCAKKVSQEYLLGNVFTPPGSKSYTCYCLTTKNDCNWYYKDMYVRRMYRR